jgi:antitoxin MazE
MYKQCIYMNSMVQKWGNSLALRLPKSIARDLKVGAGDAVELRIRGDLLQVKPARPEYRLADLLRKVNASNLHRETDWGDSVGKEIW